jgi:hypothetical protein
MMQPRRPSAPPPEAFERFEATVLFCARCREPRPVRERLLLVLPEGELYEYLCQACGASLGSRRAAQDRPALVG